MQRGLVFFFQLAMVNILWFLWYQHEAWNQGQASDSSGLCHNPEICSQPQDWSQVWMLGNPSSTKPTTWQGRDWILLSQQETSALWEGWMLLWCRDPPKGEEEDGLLLSLPGWRELWLVWAAAGGRWEGWIRSAQRPSFTAVGTAFYLEIITFC